MSDHVFVWRADSMDCSVCGEPHSGCEIVKIAAEPAQDGAEKIEISTVVLGEGRISVAAARGSDGLHAIVMQPLDQPRTVGENLLPTDGLHYLPLNRDTLRIVITHPDAAQVVIEAASAIQRVLRGATMEEVAKDYARSIRPHVNPTKHETDGVTEFPPNTFCMPNYDGKQVPQWLLFFEDRDRGYVTFDNEEEARDAFARATDHWNCTLFELVRQQKSASQEIEVCVDCRDYENNIRGWIKQLGGDPENKYLSLELEKLIDSIAPPQDPEEEQPLPELPPLHISDEDYAATMEWDKRFKGITGCVHDGHVPVSWLACRERQLRTARAQLAQAKKEVEELEKRAEQTEDYIDQLRGKGL